MYSVSEKVYAQTHRFPVEKIWKTIALLSFSLKKKHI